MAKKKASIAEYVISDENDLEVFDYLTLVSKKLVEYKYPGGYKYLLTDTGHGVVFTGGGKTIATLDYSEAAYLLLMLDLLVGTPGIKRYKLIKDKK